MGSQAEPAEGERKRLLEVRTGTRCQLSANMRLRGAFGALPTVMVLMVHETLAEDLFTPSKCVSTIVSCCNPDQPVGQHPLRCFEANECAGLYWEGTNACSDRTVARAIAALSPEEIETRVAHVDDNKVEIEFERRPVQRQPEKQNEVETEQRRRPKPRNKPNKGRRRQQSRPRRNWILLRPGQLVRPRVHPASNKHYLTIGGIGAI